MSFAGYRAHKENNLQVVIASSEAMLTSEAMQDIVQQCHEQLRGMKPQAALVFFRMTAEADVIIQYLQQQWPDIIIAGCSTYGELSSTGDFSNDSIVLTLLCSDQCQFYVGTINSELEDIGRSCSESLTPVLEGYSKPPALCLLFSDVLSNDNSELLVHYLDELLGDTLLFGGMASDAYHGTGASIIANEKISQTAASYMLIFGDVSYGMSAHSGWDAEVKRGVITKARRNLMIEIDHKPAVKFYEEDFVYPLKIGDELPLAVYDQQGQYLYMRASLGDVNENDGSIRFIGDLKEGYSVSIVTLDKQDVMRGIQLSVEGALQHYDNPSPPKLALLASCAGRRLTLGSHTSEEVQLIRELLPSTTKFVGFYTFGEVCPSEKLNYKALVHCQTLAVLLLG